MMVKTERNVYRILLALVEGDKRFSQLMNEVKKASLARELGELEKKQYVTRVVIDSKPSFDYIQHYSIGWRLFA